MKQERLQAARPKRRAYRSYVGEVSPAPENIIARDFHADAPNEKWLTDISEFQIAAVVRVNYLGRSASIILAGEARDV